MPPARGTLLSSTPPVARGKASLIIACILSTCLMTPSPSLAADEAGKFTIKEVRVINRAEDFVQEASGKQFLVESSLRFTRRATALARATRQSKFQIRIFPLRSGKFEPDHWMFLDPCYVYHSMVLPFGGSDDEAIILGRATVKWLTPAQGKLQVGRWLLVFEQLADEGEVFRLHKNQKNEYFKSGLYIEVVPNGIYSPEQVATRTSEIKNKQDQLKGDLQRNSSEVPCYRYKAVNMAHVKGEAQPSLLVLCDPNTGESGKGADNLDAGAREGTTSQELLIKPGV
jgi:hypothetical protein